MTIFQYTPKNRRYYEDKRYREATTKEEVCEAGNRGKTNFEILELVRLTFSSSRKIHLKICTSLPSTARHTTYKLNTFLNDASPPVLNSYCLNCSPFLITVWRPIVLFRSCISWSIPHSRAFSCKKSALLINH